MNKRILSILGFSAAAFFSAILASSVAYAREVNYAGGETVVYVKPGEPTQVTFPSEIEGGFRPKNSSLALEKQDNFVILFATPTLSPDGEAIIVHLDDKRSYSLRVLPAGDGKPRDPFVEIRDERRPEVSDEDVRPEIKQQSTGFAPPTIVSGLMREMILVGEFGKQKGIVGYRRSNQFTGEVVLNDGTISATVDEMFLGTDLWGYVLEVENLLDTSQRINPASFRLDGTRAVIAEKWELSPRPLTDEQKVANAHRGKLYIVTRAKRR